MKINCPIYKIEVDNDFDCKNCLCFTIHKECLERHIKDLEKDKDND